MRSTFLNCRSNGWSLRHMKGEFSSNPLWRISPFVPSTDTHSVSLILSRFLGAEKCLAQVSGARHTEKERGIEYNIFLTFQRAWEWVVPLFSFELVPKDLGSRTPKRISLKKIIFYVLFCIRLPESFVGLFFPPKQLSPDWQSIPHGRRNCIDGDSSYLSHLLNQKKCIGRSSHSPRISGRRDIWSSTPL